MPSHPINRRDLLSGLAFTAGALSACAPTTRSEPAGGRQPAGDEWQAIRAEFALSGDWVHLGGFLLASHPRAVRDAIEAHRRGLDDNPVHYLEAHERDPGPLEKAASYMGARPNEIALTDSTTMGLATLYNGLPLRPGDEILTTAHDHYATHESLRLAALRTGAVVKKVSLYERAASASASGMTDAIAKAITPMTRVVAVTWVHSCTGVKTPVTALAQVVAKANESRNAHDRVLLCLDGVHGFGVEDATMGSLACDFFVAGCHKWIFGPRGTGVIWGKEERWSLLRPTIPQFGFESYGAWMRGEPPPPTNAAMMTPGGFHSFEHRWALSEAFAFHERIGKANVAARIHALNRQCKEGLAAMKHVTLHTPMADEVSAGIICFEVSGMQPDEVVKRLHEKRIIGTQTPYVPTYARLAPGLLNSSENVDAALAAIRALA